MGDTAKTRHAHQVAVAPNKLAVGRPGRNVSLPHSYKFSIEAEGGGGERGLPGGLGICLDDVPGQWRTWIRRAAEVGVAEAFYRLVLPMVYLTDGRCNFQALNG